MELQYMVVATRPNGTKVYWNYRGFTQNLDRAVKMVSLDFAALTGKMEQELHPGWNVMVRVSEAASPTAQASPAVHGYDYANQAWITNGRYVRCGHPRSMNCGCYGKTHEGEPVSPNADVH